ncbi:hypothetical protein ACE1CD_26815 [Aerosakkonema sp. BLCC-F183]|uniref:ATPase, T2SS/T4P/T4SS family n=1 Tax=Aerosakkonema sp. BLCC-F183 TaxID=3342834 RepID=UPI0035B9BCA0
MAPLAHNTVSQKRTSYQQFSAPGSDKGMDREKYEVTFRLIDTILPFEACLYHQVLPISLEGTHLNLGMVNPDDTAALDYVRRILAYMNCSLVPQSITATQHQAVLSAYLNHMGQLKQASAKQQNSASDNRLDRHDRPTLIVDSPEELDKSDFVSSSSHVVPPSITSSHSHPAPAQIPNQTTAKRQPSGVKPAQMSVELPSGYSLPVLEVQADRISSPVEVLATLPPKKLLHELLARVLAGGIGRLYFERHQNSGRILWSQNGVLQSVLEGLDTAVFQGVINELKRLTHLSLIPVEHPKQVEIERIYQQNRLLLRLRVMPGTHGEEGTLQVLRGAALKFYQQQQLENLSRDALTMAQQLQTKINEIQKRTRIDPTLTAGQLEALPALDELVKSLNKQLEALKLLQAESHSDENRTS